MLSDHPSKLKNINEIQKYEFTIEWNKFFINITTTFNFKREADMAVF